MEQLQKKAFEAFTYLFPLVFNIQQIKRYVKIGVEGTGGAGFNAFSHASYLADADSDFVSVNNDTIYSLAGINLSGGPLLLELPESKEKYYVGQFVDAWTNNFAYVGSRGTNGEQSKIYLVPPKFTGELPKDYPIIEFPTEIGVILIRYAIDAADDLPNVQKLQQQTNLSPVFDKIALQPVPEIEQSKDSLSFFDEAIAYMTAFPASEQDQQMIEQNFADLHLTSPELRSDEAKVALKKANDEGVAYLRKLLDNNKENNAYINGWDMNLQAFDYNNQFFEIGALSDSQYVIADRPKAIMTRALSALGALWGNNAYEAAYFFLWEDEDENPLLGTENYQITFDSPPPVNGFWSLTMYNMPEFFLVANELNRYSIGDRTEGLHYERDGSLTIYLSNEKPSDPEKIANWLPAPAGQFRPILRLYLPKDEVLQANFTLPVAKKIKK
ncbi:MAG: DUF1254 domain-containing protein [Kurthia sp.]|nr:DUF1254 domain-containing protein [Candidatus Kurthia equi]